MYYYCKKNDIKSYEKRYNRSQQELSDTGNFPKSFVLEYHYKS
jgi:hypothetical protein